MPPELVLTLPNDADRPPLRVCVVPDPGGWTPGAHVVLESGNHLELNERELEWLLDGPLADALAALRDFRDGGRLGVPFAPEAPSSGRSPRQGPAAPAAAPTSPVAGQGDPDRPEPAQPSTGGRE